MPYLRPRRALALLAALTLILSACSVSEDLDPESLPTTVAELPTALAELPTTVAELPTAMAELPTTVAELPTTVAELPTAVAELPTDLAELPGLLVPPLEMTGDTGDATASPDPSPGTPAALPTASPRPARAPEEDLVAQVIRYTNEYRAENGCGPVGEHPVLNAVAQDYAIEMAEGDFFAHEAPHGSTLAERMEVVDYAYQVVGENLAAGFSSARAVVDNWMLSEDHRRNMMNCQFEDIGVGHIFLEEDPGQEMWNHYWVQILGVE